MKKATKFSPEVRERTCVDCLEEALRYYDKPSIFNTDQGSQFTSQAFAEVLKGNGVAISMDGRGRVLDNIFVERLWRSVKHEDVSLKGDAMLGELRAGLGEYFTLQALGNRLPDGERLPVLTAGMPIQKTSR